MMAVLLADLCSRTHTQIYSDLKMSESEDLRDILYNELANLTIFMRLLKYAISRQKMIKCFSVSELKLLS